MARIRGLKPVVASEIEFYLHGAEERLSADAVLELIRELCACHTLPLASAAREKGACQYEISLLPSEHCESVADHTERFKRLMAEACVPWGIQADFSPKPLPGQPGSGLHIHVHLENEDGMNMFFRKGEEFSPCLLHSLGGLLATMNAFMPVFAPGEVSYRRFVRGWDAPTTVSWGTNNRTVALRLPNKPLENKHIEHRVSGSDAEVAKVIGVILKGIEYGLEHRCDPGAPIYGDASLPQYGLTPLAENLDHAMACRFAMLGLYV